LDAIGFEWEKSISATMASKDASFFVCLDWWIEGVQQKALSSQCVGDRWSMSSKNLYQRETNTKR
jgi:hypothetical protein